MALETTFYNNLLLSAIGCIVGGQTHLNNISVCVTVCLCLSVFICVCLCLVCVNGSASMCLYIYGKMSPLAVCRVVARQPVASNRKPAPDALLFLSIGPGL